MTRQTFEVDNGEPDWSLFENIKERRQAGTHVPSGQPDDALKVAVNGGGSLGTGGGAVVVTPGTGSITGTDHALAAGDTRTLDIALPAGNDRRDVVYLSDAGTVAVREGVPGTLAWGSGVSQGARTYNNAFRPPPPSMRGVPGLVLAVVTVRAGQTTLTSDTIRDTRVGPPASGRVGGGAIQAGLDGSVVAVAPGVGVADAFDPAATQTPVSDAYDVCFAAGGGQIVLPPEPVSQASRVDVDPSVSVNILGAAFRRSVVEFTDTTDHGFVIGAPSTPPADGSYWHNFTISGSDLTQRTKDATSAVFFESSPKDWNLGTVALEGWNGSIISGTSGSMAYGSTWEHLAFGYGDNEGTILALNGQGAPLRVGQFHGGTPTADPLIATNGPKHVYLDIGTMNIGGEHGPVMSLQGGSYSIVSVGATNFEPTGTGTASAVFDLTGTIKGRFGPTLSKIGTVDDVFVLGTDHESVIGPVAIGPSQTLNGSVVRLAGAAADGASYYFGPVSDVDFGAESRRDLIPIASPETVPAPTASVTTDHTASYGEAVFADTTGGSLTLTLPPAEPGMRAPIMHTASVTGNAVTVATADTANVNGAATQTISGAPDWRTYYCDGTNWWRNP